MKDYNYYIPLLAKQLKNEYVKLTKLPQEKIRLKESDFVAFGKKVEQRLADVMLDEQKASIGYTISASTIEKLLKGKYVVRETPDKRSSDTLNKLAIFLGYKDWPNFIVKADNYLNGENTKEIVFLLKNLSIKIIALLKKMPDLQISDLENYYTKQSLAFVEMKEVLEATKKNELIIKILYSHTFIYDDSNLLVENIWFPTNYTAVALTSEQWDVYSNHKTLFADKLFSAKKCAYFLVKIHSEWKIAEKFVYTPNFQTLKDQIDILKPDMTYIPKGYGDYMNKLNEQIFYTQTKRYERFIAREKATKHEKQPKKNKSK